MATINVFGQVSDSTKTDSVQVTPEEIVTKNDSVLSSQKEEVVIKVVKPWKSRSPFLAKTVTNDSLLRWNIYPNWGDFRAYRSDVISYRQGTIGRTDAFNISGYDQYEQNLWLDDVSLNDPVTGLINYNYVPHHKIGNVQETYRGSLDSYVNIRDYYITEPISYLNFDEASNDYRNLEFFVAQNTAPGTNIELSYWDRRDGGFYPNNNAEGSQILARVYHHLGDRYQIQGMIMRNVFNNDESGGYVINEPATFSFGEFTSTPRSSSGNSEILRNDMKVGLYQRADTTQPETAGLIFSRTKNDRVLRINADTLDRELVGYSVRAFRNFETKILSIKTKVDADYINQKSGSTLGVGNWLTMTGGISGELNILSNVKILGSGEIISRNTEHSGYEFSTGLSINKPGKFTARFIGSQVSKMPTIQSLYWQSKNYNGNTALENESFSSIHGEVDISLGNFWKVGVSGRVKISSNPVVLNTDSTFSNANSQKLSFGSGYIRFENAKFELESSAAYEYSLTQDLEPNEVPFNFRDNKLWIRNSLFYKTYAFDKATFIKMGVRTLLSPMNYESQFYNTELNYWQSNSLTNDQAQQSYVPAFFRLDAELSARVRAMMIVIRWENALDGFGQAGYFEASSFPMPPRRLIVGIRAQFRN